MAWRTVRFCKQNITALHFNIVVINFSLNLEIKDTKGRTPLWLALTVPDEKINPDDEESVAARLSQTGASPDSIETSSGEENEICLHLEKRSIFIVHAIILCSFLPSFIHSLSLSSAVRIFLPTLHRHIPLSCFNLLLLPSICAFLSF